MCYKIDMAPETVQYFQQVCEDRKKSLQFNFLNYKLEKIKTYKDTNRNDLFGKNIVSEIINSFNVFFNYNDRGWGDCLDPIFWLFQSYKYNVLFTEYSKKMIEKHLSPFNNEILHFHPQNISDEDIKAIIDGISIISQDTTAQSDNNPQSSNNYFKYCNIC